MWVLGNEPGTSGKAEPFLQPLHLILETGSHVAYAGLELAM